MQYFKGFFKFLIWSTLFCTLATAISLTATYYYFEPQLPDVETLRDIELQTPMQILDKDGFLIAEFGDKRRIPVLLEEVPPLLINAFLATEDQRFFEHFGVDFKGLIRAAVTVALTGSKRQGASTITMQLARNFFLSREKTYTRKIREIFLSFKIEQNFSKEKILELYLNKIFLGHRAYGIGAAAQVYYGKQVSELTLAEMAMLAGLPKAPSSINPISNPKAAFARRQHVLERMLSQGYISQQQYQSANEAPIETKKYAPNVDVDADYLAEMVRLKLIELYGEETALTKGYRVFTTIEKDSQLAANQGMIEGLREYDQRHGFKGPIQQIDLATQKNINDLLAELPHVHDHLPAVILSVDKQTAVAQLETGEQITLPWEGLKWARKFISDSRIGYFPKKAEDILTPGDVVYVLSEIQTTQQQDGSTVETTQWQLSQIPEVSGAFVALEPKTGAIKALVGGYSYLLSKFNRVTQAERQPGSNIKPLIYSAALNKGFTAASIINDAPITYYDESLEENWRPENSDGKFGGPTRLREALIHSKNLVSVRILDAIGIDYAVDFLSRFGFEPAKLPKGPSLALGSLSATPLQIATAYASIFNGGYRVEPFYINRIEDNDGNTIYQQQYIAVCDTDCTPYQQPAQRVLDERIAYIMDSIMEDIVNRGTGVQAKALKRTDVAGKTGTTNDAKDAWFSGYAGGIVASSWVGFDKHSRSLGSREFGSKAALPVWMGYMKRVLQGVPNMNLPKPSGLVSVRINKTTGKRTQSGRNAIFEIFRKENVPAMERVEVPDENNVTPTEAVQDIF